MADTAAHLVDRVLPQAPVRQWVLSLPFSLRYRLAYDARLTGDVLRLFVRRVFASMRRRARLRWSIDAPQCGAVTFLQRFGGALNLNVHFHTLVIDGVYDPRDGMRFRPLPPPDDDEVARVTRSIARGIARLLERRGIGPDADPDEIDPIARDEPLLAMLYSASVRGRIATGPSAGQAVLRFGDRVDVDRLQVSQGERCAHVCGVSLHANVAVPPRDRRRLERLCRYAARPPLATERLSRLTNGRLLYALKHRLMAAMGKTYSSLGNHDQVLPLLEQALEIREEHLDSSHPEIADNLFELAFYYSVHGDYFGAPGDRGSIPPFSERAVAVARAAYAANDPRLAKALTNLGWDLQESNRIGLDRDSSQLAAAEKLLREAQRIYDLQAELDWLGAINAVVLAVVIVDSGNGVEEGRRLVERGMKGYERLIQTGGYVNPLIEGDFQYVSAGFYQRVGEPDPRAPTPEEFEEQFFRKYEQMASDLGPEHPKTATSYKERGLFLLEAGRFEEARAMFEKCVAILEKPNTPTASLGRYRNHFSNLLIKLGDYQEALTLRKLAHAGLEEHDTLSSVRAKVSLLLLAHNFIKVGDFEEARSRYRRASELFTEGERYLRATTTDVELMYELATLVRDAGEKEDALRLFKIVAAHTETVSRNQFWPFYADHELPARIHADYAEMLRGADRDAEAAAQEAKADQFRARLARERDR